MTPFDIAIGAVGLAVIIHASPFELKHKPFICGFCLSFWLAVVLAPFAVSSIMSYVFGVGATALLGALISAYTPFFRSLPATALEEKHVLLPDLPYQHGADEMEYEPLDLPRTGEDLPRLLVESDEFVLDQVRTDPRCFGDSIPACGELECPHCAQPVDGLCAVRDEDEDRPTSPLLLR